MKHPSNAEIAVIGAGITGLAAGCMAGKKAVVFEKNSVTGGLCGSVQDAGFTFDYSGHFLHLKNPATIRFFSDIMGPELREIERRAVISIAGKLVPYPFQANLYYLPEKLRRECIDGFLKRSGPIPPPESAFIDWATATFGTGITRLFMKPYNEKLWTVNGKRLRADWVAPFVPQPTKQEILEGSRKPTDRSFGYNARFRYPAKGGCGAITAALEKGCSGRVHTDAVAKRIDPVKRTIEFSSGGKTHYDHLINTMPLPQLIKSMSAVPSNIRAATAALDWNSVLCLNIAFKTSRPAHEIADGNHWVYFPEKKYTFYRCGMYTSVTPSSAPDGYVTMYVEISHRPGKAPDTSRCLAETIAGLRHAGIITDAEEFAYACALPIPFAYVIYDSKRTAAVGAIQSFLQEKGIYSIGRYGAWEYSFMERSVLDAMATVAAIESK